MAEQIELLKEDTGSNQVAEEISEQVNMGENLSPQEVMEKYLSDPDVIKNATYWANKMLADVSKNWFSLDRVIKKTIFKTEKDAAGILQIMCLLGICHASTDSGKLKYKITLDVKDKIMLLEDDKLNLKAEYERKIHFLDAEIERLNKS